MSEMSITMSDTGIHKNPAAVDYIGSAFVAVVLTAISYLVATIFGWVETLDYLEVFAVFTSYACTWLCVKQRRFNYVLGVISSAAYAVLFWKLDLLASMMLNIYLVPTLVYGWLRWRKDEIARPVKNLAWKALPAYAAVTGVIYFGAVKLVEAFDGQLATLDSAILIGTVLAQFLLDNKKLQNWLVWAVVNIIAIYVYATAGLYLVAFQYVLFLLNAGYGYYSWKGTMKNA